MSWDETAVFVAIAGHAPYYKLIRGTIQIAADGSNEWQYKSTGNHYYLVEDKPASQVESIINKMMMHEPM